ncbi:hypothetical protein PEC302107_32220 [Pectobacterium araliae]|uniref:Phosphotransferase system EIIC domain-containing protein n=1 Tax=Pectobacterium araliae TaxID=3073862 RepID=A0AAN0KIK7_9GAMM|nr:hypothetical protein PEC302110_34010 [Pectobacterium sp. MAFF 302110]GKW21493.1 hypothetical protein PEC302107_32220 [Pectobacterium carotovorum subsp. carotovorum]
MTALEALEGVITVINASGQLQVVIGNRVPKVYRAFGSISTLLGVMVRTKDKKLKALAGSTFIASLFGITEPGVYGVTLKLKKPFICAVIAAAIGGAIVGYAKSSAVSMGMPGLLTLPIFYGEGVVGFLIGCAIAFAVSFVLTVIVGFDDPVAPAEKTPAPTRSPVSHQNTNAQPLKEAPATAEQLGSPALSDARCGSRCTLRKATR